MKLKVHFFIKKKQQQQHRQVSRSINTKKQLNPTPQNLLLTVFISTLFAGD